MTWLSDIHPLWQMVLIITGFTALALVLVKAFTSLPTGDEDWTNDHPGDLG